MLLAVSLLASAFAFSVLHDLRDELVRPQASQLMLDRRGRYLGEVPGEDDAFGYWPPPYVLPDKVVQATLEAEDRHYFEHAGVYGPSVLRAIWQDVRYHHIVSGASTVAMQVARMQSPGSRSLLRKLREAIEALLLIRHFGHDAVLRQYLTLAPYGNRVHGVTRAARLYFDKPVEDLSWRQAAFLASLPQMPGRMNPYDPDGLRRASARAKRILQGLADRGLMPREELALALDSDLGLVPQPHRRPEAMHAVLAWSERAPEQKDQMLTTTLDLDVQQTTAQILSEQLQTLSRAGAGNGAAIVVDLPSGEVLAYVGSRDYFSEEQHGAIDYARTKRSPGSALKPFIYALALEDGRMTAATELPDTPVDFQTRDGLAYLPDNINHAFMGPMLLREALANSRNIPAMRALAEVGVEPALRFFERAGISNISYEPGRYGLGLAIGNLDVTLEELVGLYGMLAREGETLPLRRFVGEQVEEPKRLLPQSTAQLVTHILSDPLARRPSFPEGGPLDYEYAVAVKTGTSGGHRDAWAVAYSDRLLVGVWVGNHDQRKMDQLTGAHASAEAVHRIMDAVMPERSPQRSVLSAFPPPAGFVAREVCALSGKLAGPDCPHHRVEYFEPGTEPVQTCSYHATVRIDRRNGLRAGPSCPNAFVEVRHLLDLPEEYDVWARDQHLEVAPRQQSPLCPGDAPEGPVRVSIREPRDRSRYLFDPDTPKEFSTLRLSARVNPVDEEIVWIVDGEPVARVGYPFEVHWPLSPGTHTISAAMAHQQGQSRPVTVFVEN